MNLADCVSSDVWTEVVLQMLEVRDLERLRWASNSLIDGRLAAGAAYPVKRELTEEELKWFVDEYTIPLELDFEHGVFVGVDTDFLEARVNRANRKMEINAIHDRIAAAADDKASASKAMWSAMAVACARANDGAATWAAVRRAHAQYQQASSLIKQLVPQRDAMKIRLGRCCDEDDECDWQVMDAKPIIHQQQPYACEDGKYQVCRYCDFLANDCVGGPMFHEMVTVYNW